MPIHSDLQLSSMLEPIGHPIAVGEMSANSRGPTRPCHRPNCWVVVYARLFNLPLV